MLYFYDGQVRRYITQIMRMLSNFGVDDGKGGAKQVPVMYGDLTRQVANIIRDNSENKLPSAPRMAVYVTALELDRDRMSDATFVRKTNIREREFDQDNNQYLNYQGKNYTVERIMPTPFILRVNCDIWTTSTDQKLQLLEQILVLFNPSLEIQTTDNYVDWTSLSVVHLENVQFTNRSVPIGVDSEIDIATLTFSTPIFISPPAAVKRMGAITNIITSMFDEERGTVDLGQTIPELNQYDDFAVSGTTQNEFGRKAETDLAKHTANVNYQKYGIYIEGNTAQIISKGTVGQVSWRALLENLPGTYRSNLSKIYLTNLDTDSLLTGTIGLNPLDETQIVVNWDVDSFPDDSIISSSYADRTSIDAIIDPTRFNPTASKTPGLRLLTLGDIGNDNNTFGPTAWQNADGTDFVAGENDIIEWTGSKWQIVMDASATTEIIYTTNLTTGQQYRWKNDEWLLSVEGEYPIGTWRLDLDG
jgi:hypothetical protein